MKGELQCVVTDNKHHSACINSHIEIVISMHFECKNHTGYCYLI